MEPGRPQRNYLPVHLGAGNQAFNTALGNWFQAAALAIGPKGSSGTATIVISAENSNTLYSASIDADGNVTNGATVVSATTGRARSLTIDSIGNIYLFEDGGVSGILEVPAGTTGLANDKSLTRVDPNLANPTGVTVDPMEMCSSVIPKPAFTLCPMRVEHRIPKTQL